MQHEQKTLTSVATTKRKKKTGGKMLSKGKAVFGAALNGLGNVTAATESCHISQII
jgi:hypothetical protein